MKKIYLFTILIIILLLLLIIIIFLIFYKKITNLSTDDNFSINNTDDSDNINIINRNTYCPEYELNAKNLPNSCIRKIWNDNGCSSDIFTALSSSEDGLNTLTEQDVENKLKDATQYDIIRIMHTLRNNDPVYYSTICNPNN